MDAALLTAVCRNEPAAVEQRLAAGANPAAVDHEGWSALHLAAYLGHAAAASVLLRHGAAVDARTQLGCTPLHWAATLECCHMLVSAGADVDAVNRHDETPLHYAVWRHAHANVARLLAAGADARRRNGVGSSAADLASSNQPALVTLLRDAAAACARWSGLRAAAIAAWCSRGRGCGASGRVGAP